MKEIPLYQIVWTQVYESWPVEEEIVDLKEAREVLARIMSK